MDANCPPVTPGTRVTIQVKHPFHINPDGSTGLTPGMNKPSTMTVHDRESCTDADGDRHLTTICIWCITDWALDYYIVLAES